MLRRKPPELPEIINSLMKLFNLYIQMTLREKYKNDRVAIS
ncbi:hypothetical protein ECDEC12E_5273 [Escherichia coli DEC12E]|nr:hypothetical protein ECDEC12E_5362 [Escherichia coli DEC12E]EHX40285.1 hypothetical protein ECDEC12E_5273 [Escherichia coli DEC12E]